MEFISVLLSGLLLIVSPVGVVVDQVAANAIRQRLIDAEELEVRVDNAPTYQMLQGRVQRVRIGSRGVVPIADLRIDTAELEAEGIDLDIGRLQQGQVMLDEPLEGAVRLVLTATDLNRFLQSASFAERFANLSFQLGNAAQEREAQRYQIKNPKLFFLGNERLQLSVDLVDDVSGDSLRIVAAANLGVDQGSRLIINDPEVSVNDEPAPRQLIDVFLSGVNERLSLRNFESRGVTARVLQFDLDTERLELALWVRIDPSFTQSLPQ